jgi:hypothetical protein
MLIGTFRRNVAKTLTPKATKVALRTVSKNTQRMLIAQGAVALKGHTGQLLQATGQYLLGLQQSLEMKQRAFVIMGDIGADLTALSRVLKIKVPSTTKKAKLSGTRGAAILQLDSLATDILRQTEKGLFTQPQMTTVTKLVTMPRKGGAKEERQVAVVDGAADLEVEQARQTTMKSFLAGAVDLYWRLCFDMLGTAPEPVLQAKMTRLKQEFPSIDFDAQKKKAPVQAPAPVAAKGKAKPKPKAAAEPVPA